MGFIVLAILYKLAEIITIKDLFNVRSRRDHSQIVIICGRKKQPQIYRPKTTDSLLPNNTDNTVQDSP